MNEVDLSDVPTDIPKEERTWAMLCHLGTFGFYVFPILGNFIIPLVIWLMKRDDMPYVREQGRESINFQITTLIYGAIAGILCFVLIGFLLLPLVLLFQIVFALIASIKTYDGKPWRYPAILRLV